MTTGTITGKSMAQTPKSALGFGLPLTSSVCAKLMAIIAVAPTTDPDDRSMPPVMMTCVTPSGMTGGAVDIVLTNANGGRLLVTNAAADNDSSFSQKVGEGFLFATGKRAFFRALFQVSDATESDFIMGLQITDTTPLAVTDGVFFQKDDDDALLDFHVEKDSVQVDATGIFTVLDATDLEVAFYWDGIDRIWYGVNGTALGFVTPGASLPDNEELTVSFGIQNGEAVAKTMTVDYIFAAMER